MEIKYRGGIKIDYSLCTGCGICYEVCLADILGFDSETKLLTVEYPEECCYCAACVMDCPANGAIRMELPLSCL